MHMCAHRGKKCALCASSFRDAHDAHPLAAHIRLVKKKPAEAGWWWVGSVAVLLSEIFDSNDGLVQLSGLFDQQRVRLCR